MKVALFEEGRITKILSIDGLSFSFGDRRSFRRSESFPFRRFEEKEENYGKRDGGECFSTPVIALVQKQRFLLYVVFSPIGDFIFFISFDDFSS